MTTTSEPPSDDSHAQERPCRVLVVGQTPPPYHGQSIMLERLIQGNLAGVELHHVRLAFSKSMDDVGRFQWGKVFHLLGVLGRMVAARVAGGVNILYYPPAGPQRVPMWRDLLLLIATRWMFRKTIFHMHAGGISSLHEQLSPPVRWLFRRAYFYPDAVVRMSDRTPDDARGLRARAEFLVPNCADDEWETYRGLREVRGSEAGRPAAAPLRLLYLGTVCETKGILDLLAACRRLAQGGTPFELHIVGSFQPAAFQAKLRQQLADLDLQPHVVIHGQLTGRDKFMTFAQADVFCMPTFYENEAFPCVLLEAMSFGLPVVATRWRGIPSIVDHGVTGWLVAPHDVEGLTARLEELAREPALRERMGAAGRARFVREYTVQQHLDQMRRVFLAVAGEGPSPHPVALADSLNGAPASPTVPETRCQGATK